MRPIDADAMYQRYCVEARGLDGIYDTTDLPEMLREMPTIPAIPVEWLREFDLYYAGISGGSPYMKALIEAWKEQEAR